MMPLNQLVDELSLFRALLNQCSLGLVVIDADTRIQFVNPVAQGMCDCTEAAMLGQRLDALLPLALSPQDQGEMRNCLAQGQSWAVETRITRSNGTFFWCELQLLPVTPTGSGAAQFCACLRDISAHQQDAEKIVRLSTLDHLTLLPNRAQFRHDLSQLLANTAAGDVVLMAYIDVDQLKAINDSLGQATADELLRTLANRLREASRRQDLVARLSGDEFALVLSGGDDSEAMQSAAERLLRSITQSCVIGGHEVSFSVSVGTALFPADAHDADELVGCAEIALLAAKRESGGAFRRFQAGLGQVGKSRSEAVEGLRQAIRNNELVLHYQPQVSLQSGHVVGLEALVRWLHPTHGLLAPGHFIPLAEECGLVIALDDWVMRTAVAQIRRWLDQGLPPVRVAVNLSARHFRQRELPETIDALLKEYAIPAHLIELELTESVMMHDAETAIRIVERLKALGLRISLDDFGTGYSSLAYLSRFAIDVIKIDQSFVRDITTNPVNASIATATIAMAHKLGKTVIAEGVESEGQMMYLRRHECDEMQGYHFSRPVPAERIGDILRSNSAMSLGAEPNETQLTLLLVDDEPSILSALKRLLRREGYHILCAESAAQGLELLATHLVQVIISDQRMPGMTGTEFLGKVKDLYPDTVRLVLSGYSELNTLTEAINKGAIYRYLSKPWDDEKLKQEVTQAFRYYREQRLHLSRAPDATESAPMAVGGRHES